MRLNLVQSDWCSYKRLGHTERDLGDAARRWPPAGQEEKPQRKSAPPCLQLRLPASRTERREFLLFEPRCWCSAMSMLANSYNIWMRNEKRGFTFTNVQRNIFLKTYSNIGLLDAIVQGVSGKLNPPATSALIFPGAIGRYVPEVRPQRLFLDWVVWNPTENAGFLGGIRTRASFLALNSHQF